MSTYRPGWDPWRDPTEHGWRKYFPQALAIAALVTLLFSHRILDVRRWLGGEDTPTGGHGLPLDHPWPDPPRRVEVPPVVMQEHSPTVRSVRSQRALYHLQKRSQ